MKKKIIKENHKTNLEENKFIGRINDVTFKF